MKRGQEVTWPPSPHIMAVMAVGLFLMDLLFSHGAFAILTMLFVLPALLVLTLVEYKDKRLMKQRLVAFCIALSATLITMQAVRLNNEINDDISKERASLIIDTCERYKVKNDHYPNTLSQLIPEFLPSIPVARYSLASNEFHYHASDDSPILWYMARPPFGKQVYSFEQKRWKYLD
ncbi:MAG: hypothetical protein HQL05_00120 [Nitrospirae bacterium]|nr:hypothetical protein [Nitrospirota bacterium]